MSQRPDKIGWGNTDVIEPSDPKKALGWLKLEKPAYQFLNWIFRQVSLDQFYVFGQSQEYIVISSDSDEQDYATLAAYIADAPAAGDKVLVKETQVITAQMIIPDSITLRILDGVNFTRSTLDAASVIKLGSNIIIEGVLNLILSQTGTTAKGIEINGDNIFGDIIVENSSTGTLTDAFAINAAKGNNHIRGIAQNTGGGTLTNVLTDSSAEDSNNVMIVDEANTLINRSNGIIFEKNIRDISRNLVIQNNSGNPLFQMDIDADEVILQDSSGNPFRATSVNETVDIEAGVGAGGLDAGSEAGSTWYFMFLIAKPDGTVDSLLSLSSTAPTMPSGYTFKALVGAIYNDSGSDFITITQEEHVVKRGEILVLNAGAATSPTPVNLAVAVPTTAKRAMGTMNTTNSVTVTNARFNVQDSNALNNVKLKAIVVSVTADAPFEASTDMEYFNSIANQSSDIRVSGWKF